MGAPGSGLSRREFVAATGTTGIVATAGCASAPINEAGDEPAAGGGATEQDLPTTTPPQVVNVDEQGNQVTLKNIPAVHPVHPGESMGGPVELPQVWAFQADDGNPSVPGPVLRTTAGEDMDVVLDNTQGMRPHTVHFHGVTKTWENDGVPTTTGIQVAPGETHTYEIPANVPGTHFCDLLHGLKAVASGHRMTAVATHGISVPTRTQREPAAYRRNSRFSPSL